MNDESLRQAIWNVSSAYVGSFHKKDGAAIAALFANDGVHINAAGPRKDIEEFYQAIFQAGLLGHYETSIDEFWSLSADVAVAIGVHSMTGNDESGEPIERLGRWTATYVREGGSWKIKVLAALPRA